MVSWYYVIGSERMGPVNEEALKQLFLNNDITGESYIWKKGFQNWERLKDVKELNFDGPPPVMEKPQHVAPVVDLSERTKKVEMKADPKVEVKPVVEENSPEVQFSFHWGSVKPNEDLFFVKIGKDRKNLEHADIYGPYSMTELKEALKEKRVNLQTLVFAPGMSSWIKIQDTPINSGFTGRPSSGLSLSEVPLVLVFAHSPLPLVTIVKKSGTKEGILLGSGPFSDFKNKTVKASLYVGSEMKVKNVQIKIQGYDKKYQSMECQFIDLDQDAKKIMLTHAV